MYDYEARSIPSGFSLYLLLSYAEMLLQLVRGDGLRLVDEVLPIFQSSESEFCSFQEMLKTRKSGAKLESYLGWEP